MATPTYIAIASITLGSSASSITFSSIPQDYRDLVLVLDGSTTVTTNVDITINADTASNYSFVTMEGDGSSPNSNSNSDNNRLTVGTSFDTEQGTIILQFMDYSATDKHKTFLERFSNVNHGAMAAAFRYANISAITSVEIFTSGGSFNTGTTLALYGIEA